MTARTSAKTSSTTTVTLTRRQVEIILVYEMGWEPIDVTSFWRLARRLNRHGAR